MDDHAGESARKPRADALRNRERVLEAAKQVFSAGGADASLEAIARRAGLGIGTLYRHFPTRQALFEAVYRREVEQLVELAGQLKAKPDPVEALRCWMHANVEFAATKRGMSAALALAIGKPADLTAITYDSLRTALAGLMERATQAHLIRADINPEDILRTLVGIYYAHEAPGWQAKVLRLVDVFVDGLCNVPGR